MFIKEIKWKILLGCLLSFSVFHANRQILAIILPDLGSTLNLTYTQISFLASAYDFGYMFTLVAASLVVIRIGKRKSVLAGLCIVILSMLTIGIFPTYTVMLVSRFIAGIGFSLYFSSGISLVSDFFSPQERSKAYGLHSSGSSLGQMYGIFIAGTITSMLTWRWSFFFCAVIAILIAVLVIFILFFNRDSRLSNGRENAPLAIASQLHVLKSRGFWIPTLTQCTSFACYMVVVSYLPLLLTREKNMALSDVTVIITIMYIIAFVSNPFLGTMSDRFGIVRIMPVAFLVNAALSLSILKATGPLIVILVLLMGMFVTINFTLSISLLSQSGPKYSSPVSFGFFNTAGLAAGLLFLMMAGKFSDLFGLAVAFQMISLVNLVSALLSAILVRKQTGITPSA